MLDINEENLSVANHNEFQTYSTGKLSQSSSKILEISDGSTILARYIPAKVIKKPGLNFYSHKTEFIQFGVWGYDSGKSLPAHIHNRVNRTNDRTQEAIFVQQGKIKATIFDLSGTKIRELIVSQGDVIILLTGAHGYEILEDQTQVLEFKNGPYVGPELDRKRI